MPDMTIKITAGTIRRAKYPIRLSTQTNSFELGLVFVDIVSI